MGMTAAQRQRLEEILNQLDEREMDIHLSGVESFSAFLQRTARDIWESIRGAIQEMWQTIRSWFD